jgi:hypothetical protein
VQHHADLLRSAISTWENDPVLLRRHLSAAMAGEPWPKDVYAARERAKAEALFYEVTTNPRRAPRLYRGAATPPSGLTSWTTSRRVAERFAAKHYGRVFELPAGELGMRVKDYDQRSGHPAEREWVLWIDP